MGLHWLNMDANSYYGASDSVIRQSSPRRIRKNAFSFFNLENYQVVRSPYLSALPTGPSISISGIRISFNRDCIRRFDSVEFVQLLIHPTKRKVAIRPCEEADLHSIVWRRFLNSKMVSKSLICPCFSAALFEIMGWNPEYTYRVRGSWYKQRDEQIIVFDLDQPEIMITCDTTGPQNSSSQETSVKKRLTTYPEDWKTSFGLPFYEYQIRNQCLELGSRSSWNSNAKCKPVQSRIKIDLLTPTDLEDTISQLRHS